MGDSKWILREIAQVPANKGRSYGPCLLSPGVNSEDWVLGEWDGCGWWSLDGEHQLSPTHYLLLPPRSDVL